MKSLALLKPNLSEVLGDARLTCFFYFFIFFILRCRDLGVGVCDRR